MSDKETEILEATRRVLAAHGFHGLTTQRVAEEIDANNSLIHYYFDTKEDLLAAFLDYYREEFGAMLSGLSELPPGERLATFLAVVVSGTDHESIRALNLAVYELQAHAARQDAYQESLEAYGAFVREFLIDCIEAGIETGEFEAVDPDATATLLLSALDGAMLSQFTTGGEDVDRVAFEALPEYVLSDLYADEPPDLRALVEGIDLEAMAERTGESA